MHKLDRGPQLPRGAPPCSANLVGPVTSSVVRGHCSPTLAWTTNGIIKLWRSAEPRTRSRKAVAATSGMPSQTCNRQLNTATIYGPVLRPATPPPMVWSR